MNRAARLHPWLKTIRVHFMPGVRPSKLQPEILEKFRQAFIRNGHAIDAAPTEETDIVITDGDFGRPIQVPESATFDLWRSHKLSRFPTVVSLAFLRTDDFGNIVSRLSRNIAKPNVDRADYRYAGLSSEAYRVLSEQGRRGGPVLALSRILQAQLKSFRVVLLVGESEPARAYHFDLVGSTACTRREESEDAFYDDIVHRIATAVSTTAVTEHVRSDSVLPLATWDGLDSVRAMCRASAEFDRRHFFTDAVSMSDILDIPSVSENIARQYSEGCFATWDPTIGALVATITGAAKLLNKGDITPHDLVPIQGPNAAGTGVIFHEVNGKEDHPPSSEAFEMMSIVRCAPERACPLPGHSGTVVPTVRSQLHGHRGIRCYDPRSVEYTPLDETYFRYPVTCGTEAQAQALSQALARSESLNDPEDARRVVFTILPSHGVFIVEKWSADAAPFQLIWEAMDKGAIQVEHAVPQAPFRYQNGQDGRLTRLET